MGKKKLSLKEKLKKAAKSARKTAKELTVTAKKGVKEAQKGAKKVVEGWEKARDIATEAQRRGMFQSGDYVFGEDKEQRVASTTVTPEGSQKPTVIVVTRDIGDVRDLIGMGGSVKPEEKGKRKKKKKKSSVQNYILG